MGLHRMEDTGRRKPRAWLWVVLAVVFSAAAALGADARSNEPSLVQVGRAPLDWKDPGPPPKDACNGPTKSLVKVYESRTMCGTPGRDKKLTVPKDATISVYGLGGNDKIIAKGPVKIYGGPGKDRADVTSEKLASCWRDTEKVYDARNKRLPCGGRAFTRRATDFDPSKVPTNEVIFRPPAVKCGVYTTNDWFVRFSEEPLLRAFNAIEGKVEFQKVAFAAALYKWDAAKGAWASYRNPVWLWDETHDRDWLADLDYWRTFDTLKRIKMSFTIRPSEPGYYRAAVQFHWYSTVQRYGGQNVNVPDYDIQRWVEDHFHFSNDRTGRYPKDRYCAFGVDPLAGP
jgi:hypothetical protein